MNLSKRPFQPDTPLRPLPLGTAAEIQALEKRLIEEWGTPAAVLMERAALAAVHLIERLYPDAPVAVLAGMGSNGADGLAVARLLFDRGRSVRILTVGASWGEAVSRQMTQLAKRGIQARPHTGAESFAAEWVLVDALFGIGLNRTLKPDAKLAIDWANAQPWRGVVSLDLPSGLNPDDGGSFGAVVTASHTVCFGALKPAVVTDPALRHVGKLWFADIGFPAALTEALPARLNVPAALAAPAPDAHKGTMGSVLLVAGSAGMSGAAILAARAACHSGVGLVYLATPESQRAIAAVAVPEAIVLGLPEENGELSPDALLTLAPHFARAKAVAMGPGLGRSAAVRTLVGQVLSAYEGPVVLDADALPHAGEPWAARTAAVVMTPHAGELGRMLGRRNDEVQADRFGAAREAAARFGALVAFKGARTLIARPDGTCAVNASGNPMLATAGSGDVLTGLTLGLLGRGLAPDDAIRTAVYTHGMCAEKGADQDMVSLTAMDLIAALPHVLGRPARVRERIGDALLVH